MEVSDHDADRAGQTGDRTKGPPKEHSMACMEAHIPKFLLSTMVDPLKPIQSDVTSLKNRQKMLGASP